MSRKTTIFVTTIAALSIGALGAGAAAGLVKVPGPAAGQAAQIQAAPPGGQRAQAQFADAGPRAFGGAAQIGGRDGPGAGFGPGLQAVDNPAQARRFGGGGGQRIEMAHMGGGRMAGPHRAGGFRGDDRDLDLTADEAGTLIAAQLIMQGNDRLKVGAVTSQGEDTYIVDVVTLEDSLVMRIEVDRETGRRAIIR